MGNEKKKDMVREQPMTYADYAKLDDGERYELVDGVLELMSPAPSPDHQSISAEIYKRFLGNCEESYVIFYAPIDLILSDTVVRQPDLVLVHRNRFAQIVKKRGIVGVPDLVVEILSPSSVKRDKLSKLNSYARFAIPEYWIVDPKNRFIEQYVHDGQQYPLPNVYAENDQVQSEHIKCVSFSMNEIMANVIEAPDD